MSAHNPGTYHDLMSSHHQTTSSYGLNHSSSTSASAAGPNSGNSPQNHHVFHSHQQALTHHNPHSHAHAHSHSHGAQGHTHGNSSAAGLMYSFLPPGTPSDMTGMGSASVSTPNNTGPSTSLARLGTPAFGMTLDMSMGMGDMALVAPPPPTSQPGTTLQRSSRPCDTCRVRKTRCVRQDNSVQCILCAFHGKQCTYLRGPPPRGSSTAANRHKDKERTRASNGARTSCSSSSPSGSASTPAPVSAAQTPLPTLTPAGPASMTGSVKGESVSNTPTTTTSSAVAGLKITSAAAGSSSVVDTTEGPRNDSDNDHIEVIHSDSEAPAPGGPMHSRNNSNMQLKDESMHSPPHQSHQSHHQHSQHSQHSQHQGNNSAGPSPRSTPISPSPELLPLLSGTLGLSLATHPEYIGPTSHREPALLDLQRYDMPTRAGSTAGSEHSSTYGGSSSVHPIARRIDDRTMFLIYPDEATASEEKRIADCDAVEACVRPLGKALVDLYFRIVHPTYPVLHKELFISKHANSHRCFAPPLLAAVYLIALDYQLYDPNMASGTMQLENPHGPIELEALAESTLQVDLKRPKISTLQAGLLLLQRHRPNGASSDWMFTAQMVALAQGLGLHVDCTAWEIPEWEKGLRRRLGWALYVQDRWGVFSHGRLRLLSDEDWDLQPCSTADFPESSEDEDPAADGNIEVEAGRELFIRQAELARILTEVMTLFYTSAATKPGGTLDRMGVVQAVEMARPVMIRLREWRNSLPAKLQLDCIEHRKLSANGSLHLALAATEAALHRALVRLLTPSSPPELVNAVRAAATNRVVGAIGLLKALRPEHMGAFWSGASAHQVAMIGSLAGLLWVTSVSREEMQWREGMMTELRWVLRVRGQSSGFIREALRLLENDLGRVGVNATQGLLGDRTPGR